MKQGGNDRFFETESGLHCRGCCTRLENFSVRIGGRSVVNSINLHFHCGEFAVLIGPNGAGKSTLLRAMAGDIAYEGKLIFHRFANTEPIVPRIGYVPQKIPLDAATPLSVKDLFVLSLSKKPGWIFSQPGIRRIAFEALGNVNAQHLVDRKLGELSQGELQRVILSLALTPRPDILLLDEPVSGIDYSGLAFFYRMISKLRETHDLSIVMVSHDLAFCAKYADRFIFLNRGSVTVGKPQDIIEGSEVRSVFGELCLHSMERVSSKTVHHGEA